MSNPAIRGWVGAGEKGVSFSPVSGNTPIFVRASDAVRTKLRDGLWTDGVKTHVMDPEVPQRVLHRPKFVIIIRDPRGFASSHMRAHLNIYSTKVACQYCIYIVYRYTVQQVLDLVQLY